MKKFPAVFCALWVMLLGIVAFGQIRSETATLSMPLPMPPPLDIDIRDQPDSPLQLAIDDKVRGRMPGSALTIRNTGSSAITAFVLRLDVEPYGLNQMVILGSKGLGIGESRIHGLSAPRFGTPGQSSAKPVASVDHVRFADGKTWGEDSLGRGKHIAVYLDGRSLAMSRLNELLVGRDDTDFRKAFEVFGSSSFAEPIMPTGRGPRNMDWWSRGYEEILNILRRMPRNSDLARDLARQVEVMPRPHGY